MRVTALSLIAAVALTLSAASANAALTVPVPMRQQANIVQVAGGCGWGFHPNRWGHCVPNHYGYYRPQHWPGYYYPGYYYGDGYGPQNRPSPGDHVARQLNRQQLHGY
jgi:hypothetical protein